MLLPLAFAVCAAVGCDDEIGPAPVPCDKGEWTPTSADAGASEPQVYAICSQEEVDLFAGYTSIAGVHLQIGFATADEHDAQLCPGGGASPTHITNLDALGCVESIEGALAISYTDLLDNLDGLAKLSSLTEGHFGWDLYIHDNAALPMCEAENLRTQLHAAGWNGNAIIERNYGGGTCDE
jgi:hypothetical protein